ncbi:uncharacterized protein LOC135459657 [Zonotrichia leucophrys gambelii]|uniref:uncharacterized protein LOC135459657 n=1 Tax=Zonotrichia leucophrys gambelii TaxID=257770 RepID=UPI003140878E
MITLLILFCILPQFHGQPPGEQLWPEAIAQHTNVLGTYPKGRYPSLATLVQHDSKVYRPNEWRWDQNELMWTLMGTVGESIVVTCRKVEGTLHEKATSIIIAGNFMEAGGRNHLDIPSAKLCPTKKWGCSKIESPVTLCCRQEHVGSYVSSTKTTNVAITRDCNDESLDCWYSFTLVKPTYVTCRWENETASPLGLRGLVYTFKINTVPKPTPSAVITLSQTQSVNPFSNVTPQLAEATGSHFTWPWSQAFLQSTGSMGNVTGLNLLTVVTHEDKLYTRQEWEKHKTWQLQGVVGELISVGCRMVNGSDYSKAMSISASTDRENKQKRICTHPSIQDCWYSFTLTDTTEVICLWAKDTQGLSFEFVINAETTVTTSPVPPVTLTPRIFEIGPYVIRKTGQQQILFNPAWSLKQVKLLMQNNVSDIQPACSPFLQTSFEGWTTWLRKRSSFKTRTPTDVTGVVGTGLGILNSIDSEVLMNKLAATTRDLTKLQQSLRSSLLALGMHQGLLSNILPNWERVNVNDHKLVIDALSATQDNVSLALSCIQAQLWMQSVSASIIREGEEGTFPTEIQKIIWDSATEFEREFQSWWKLVNFTYDPISNTATAFVLTIRNACVHLVFPVIALGLNHDGAVLYPTEHRGWARQVNDKWQTVNLESCIVREQQGFICESNAIAAQDICLDTEENICHFEIRPYEDTQTVLIYIGNGCACFRTTCDSVFVEDVVVDTKNHSNFCACNFTEIVGCDFFYKAPVTSHYLLQSNYTLIQKLMPTPIGMNPTLVRQLLLHQDLVDILEKIKENEQKTLVTVHHNVRQIHRVMERVKQDAEHRWWGTLFGWSPTATGVLNSVCHPIVVLLILVTLGFILSAALFVMNWNMMKKLSRLPTVINAHRLADVLYTPDVLETLDTK